MLSVINFTILNSFMDRNITNKKPGMEAEERYIHVYIKHLVM